MKVLYVGHYGEGSTSRMRGEYLQKLLGGDDFLIADIDTPISKTSQPFLSLGWRYKKGPLIVNINRYLSQMIKGNSGFDLVWIDKGVFIEPSLLTSLKNTNNFLVHYTPDTAFLANRSKLFYQALPLYDFCITTKSFEVNYYKRSGVRKLLTCTQGYDPRFHKSYHDYSAKHGVAFVGLCEPLREEIIQKLVDRKILVKLAGENWDKFIRRNKGRTNLQFYGNGVFGEAYGRLISGSLIGLGLLSKKFPEMHTTRTFEIPACGTALATERNEETNLFFGEEEVIFFSSPDELVNNIEYGLSNEQWLKDVSEKGTKRVTSSGYDYEGILKKLIAQMKIGK